MKTAKTPRRQTSEGKARKTPIPNGAAVGAPAAVPRPLTRKKTGRTLAAMFLPYQLDWINDESAAKLGDKSRRTGFTRAEAYDKVSRRFRLTNARNRAVWMAGRDESTAYEFIDYCRFFARDLFGVVADYFVEPNRDANTGRESSNFVIRCPNGARITGMSSAPGRWRSKGGDAILDEWDHHDQQEAIYDAAQPTVMWGDQLSIFSNVAHEDRLFSRFVKNCKRVLTSLGFDPGTLTHCPVSWEVLSAKAKELGVGPVFSYHRVTLEQAVDQGLVELMNRTRGTNFTRSGFLERIRAGCRNREHWLQEYGCTAAMDLSAALKYHVIEACMHEQCPQPVDGFENLDQARRVLAEHYTGGPIFGGVDVGDTQDLTTFWLLEPVGDVLWTRLIYRMKNESMVDQEAALLAILGDVKLARCAILRRGVGVGIHAHAERRFGVARIAGINETRPIKIGLVTGFVQVFEDRHIRVPDHPGLKESLHSMREARTPGGQVTYDAPRRESGHADEFSAGSAAVDAAAVGGGGLTAEDVRVLSRVAGVGRGVPDQRPRATDVVRGPRGYRW